MKNQRPKKVSRTYRVSPSADRLVKLGASLLKLSEVDVLEVCLVEKVADVCRQYLCVKRMLKAEQIPDELERAILDARRAMIERWNKK